MGFLIDTCIWIDLERGVISPADIAGYTGEEAVHISPVVIAELTFGAEMAAKEEIRIRRLAAIERLKEKPFVLIDQKTGEIFGKLAATLRKEGKEHKYRIQDLWLASQAIRYNLRLLTKNPKDFEDLSGLDVVNFKPVIAESG